MDVLLRTWRTIPWQRFTQALLSPSAELFVAGILLGVLAACGLTQFQAHWGSSGPMERGLAATAVLGLFGGWWAQRRNNAPWPVWLMLSATLSLIVPWWLDQFAELLFRLPVELVRPGLTMELLGVGVGLASLSVPVLCWTGLVCSACAAADSPSENLLGVTRIGFLGAGCALGVFATAMVWGPWIGLEITTILCAALGLAVGYRAWYGGVRRPAQNSDQRGAAWRPAPNLVNVGLIGLGLIGCGGALSLSHNLTGQLMPQTAYLQLIAWAVITSGVIAGLWIASRSLAIPSRPAWAVLLLAAGLSFNGFAFETGIRISLWSAAFLINPTLHQLALAGLVVIALFPMSVAAGVLIGAPRAGSVAMGIAAIILGETCFRELAVTPALWGLTVGLSCGTCCLALLMFLCMRGWAMPRWQMAAAITGLACGGLSPLWQPAFDPALPAQLLFSTPTFLAYRSGWATDLLPQLDDSRLVATAAGRHGPLTVWKSRSSDLMLREAGIPRSAISCRPDLSPQLPSEVLQAVFPLVVAKEARSVLLLGSSGGIPLSTCLSFPVQQVTCVEPDAERIALIRGPLAAERGFDPFSDERVAIDHRSVELAAMMSDGGYDMILSSPPMSAVVAAAPQFTKEFYRNVSRKLSVDGLFCQRLEAVDYGPRPFQLVVRGLQAAFREVVAVEIGVGEYLFLATNSERGLTPGDLPARLETPHVRRVLARCGWDWSTLLTLSAWDHAALQEIAAEGTSRANTAANCRLAFAGPRDMLRWSPKLKEVHELLTKPRSKPLSSSVVDAGAEPSNSRRTRYLDWLGNQAASQDLLRRLSEVAAQTKIILDGPDSFWLDYRKALRDQLQQRPRTEIRQVVATDETERVLHPEDERRKEYFVDLGRAGDLETRSLDAVYQLTNYFEPYDPLVSLFARQETAELLRMYGHPEPAAELAMRLYVIHFAPGGDRSLRNVLSAAELILRSPEAAPDPQDRFDILNGLLQTFRRRWEVRSASQIKSVRLAIQDVDRSIVVIDKIVRAMDELVPSTQLNPGDWQTRKEVIDRALLRPLHGYRADLLPQYQENKAKAEAVLRDAKHKKK